MGTFWSQKEKPHKAAAAYERAVDLAPNMPTALNNLAWFLATTTEPDLRDPGRALALARRAAELRPEAFILDTLAECLFANGLTGEAVSMAREAIKKADPKDRPLYENQLRKFQTAAPAGTPLN